MIIGIDPGFTGGIAFLKDDKLIVLDLPVIKIKNKKQIDAVKLTKLITKHAKKPRFAVIEEVGARPGQGIASTGRFLYNAGILLGIFASTGIEVIKVLPSVWKPALGLSSDKKKSLKLAIKLFPKYKDSFRLMKHDGRAEAALIAYYANKCF